MNGHQVDEASGPPSNVISMEAGRPVNAIRPTAGWPRALQIIDEVAEHIACLELHAQETTLRAEDLITSAVQNLQTELARACAAEVAYKAAELRACRAEARLRESEEWLRKLRHALNEKMIEPRAVA